ncbi:MAG TPA: hypothetical protein VIX41_08850 [Acidimicrobiales bacterium]
MAGEASTNLHGLAIRIRAVPRSGMIAAAKTAKRIAAEEGTRAGGPLVGKKRRGLKLRARDDIRPSGTDGWSCRIQGVSPAGWVWVTTGTRPHKIRRRRRGPMRRMTVDHPGTGGRGAWWRVVARVEDVVPAIFVDEVRKAVR